MLRSLLTSALRSRGGYGTGTRRGYGGRGGYGGGYGGRGDVGGQVGAQVGRAVLGRLVRRR